MTRERTPSSSTPPGARPDPADAPSVSPRRLDLTPILVLVAAVVVMGLGFWLFPYALAYVHQQDCIAAGRVDCG